MKIYPMISVRKKHLDELHKTRYTIKQTKRGCSPQHQLLFVIKQYRSVLCLTRSRTLILEEEYQPDLMTLEDEDGNEVTFEVIDALDHKGVHYLAVVEYAENEEDLNEDAQLVILSVGEDDEGEYLDVVEDDEVLMEVSKLFEQRLSEDYDIE